MPQLLPCPHLIVDICGLRWDLRCRLFISTVPSEPLARIKNSLGELYPAAQCGAFHEGHQAVPAGAYWPFFPCLCLICVVHPGAEMVCHASALLYPGKCTFLMQGHAARSVGFQIHVYRQVSCHPSLVWIDRLPAAATALPCGLKQQCWTCITFQGAFGIAVLQLSRTRPAIQSPSLCDCLSTDPAYHVPAAVCDV